MLQPTVTHRVRAFLDAEGVRLEPWASLDETYARLYALLAERREDPAFWPALGALLQALVREAAEANDRPRLASPIAELLSGSEIDRLVADLRRSLPEPKGGLAPLADFTAALRAPVLCGFLLLGLAAASAGCIGPDEVNAAPAPSPRAIPAVVPAPVEPAPPAPVAPPVAPAAPVDAPWFDGCPLPEKGVLWRSIDRSALADDDKRALCDCFSELGTRWTNRLSYLFRNGKPKEIAKALEEMVACCEAEDKAENTACADVAKIHGAVQQRTVGLSFSSGVAYKGVCFDLLSGTTARRDGSRN